MSSIDHIGAALSRRAFACHVGAVAALAALRAPRLLRDQSPSSASQRPAGPGAAVDEIALVLYPKLIAVDLVAVQFILAALADVRVHLVAASLEPVQSDSGVALVPTATFASCPADLAVLFVPGGLSGTIVAMEDAALMSFIADRGSRARFVTSACTGSLLLGAAGLLSGHQATTHWLFHDSLRHFGATPSAARVVTDRNRMTGAGVTAGMDLGLTLASALRGQQYAEVVQLLSEYAPVPPFHSGNPMEANPDTVDGVRSFYARGLAAGEAAAVRAAGRLKAGVRPR